MKLFSIDINQTSKKDSVNFYMHPNMFLIIAAIIIMVRAIL